MQRFTLAPTLMMLILSATITAEEIAPTPAPTPAPATEPAPAPAPVSATEAAPAPAPAPVATPATEPSNWKNEGRLGAFFNNTATGNADISRDPTIGGAGTSTSVLGALDYKALWAEGKNSVDHIFKARYGRIRTNGADFTENEDEARYDGVYRRELAQPHFIYSAWGAETVWSGPYKEDPTRPPDNVHNNFDPLLVKISAGYGQRYANFFPEDKLEWRLGARAQKRWGSQITEDQRGIETGIEAFFRYEGTPVQHNKDLKYFVQYEGFSEFNDIQHITNLVTAGLTFQLSKYINLELALRAFYETRVKEDRDAKLLTGYNQWSVKQDTMVGVVYNF